MHFISEMTERSAHSAHFVPKWLNSDFISSHLRNYFNDSRLHVLRFDVRSAVADGVNFSSTMYRVHVSFVQWQSEINLIDRSFIIKIPVSNQKALASIVANNVYKKEIEFYSEIAPRIGAMLDQLGETKQLLANCYGVCPHNDVLLLEDLATKSYAMPSVFVGFNLDEAKLVLQKLAAFHAINAILQQKQPNIFENFKYGLVSRHNNVNDKFYLTLFDAMKNAISTWPNANYYVPKLERLRSKLLEDGCKTHDPDPCHFNTLIHGDLWVNNIMTNYKTQPEGTESSSLLSVGNMIFIDFQYACWTSPATDLHFFFNTSLHESLRPDRFDDLLTYYHGHLASNLKRLGYEKSIPNLDQFKQQYRDKSFYGFIASCMVHPMLINENTEKADYETLRSDNEQSLEFKRKMFAAPKVRANLQKLIPMYDEMGTFD